MKCARFGWFGIIGLGLASQVRAGDDDALSRKIQVNVSRKPFAEVVRELAKAAEIQVSVPDLPPKKGIQGGHGKGSLGGDPTAGTMEYVYVEGVKLFTLTMNRPESLDKMLKIICDDEKLAYKFKDDKLVIGDPAMFAAEKPFDPDAIKFRKLPPEMARKMGQNQQPVIVVERDWKKAMLEIVKMGHHGEEGFEDKPTVNTGMMGDNRLELLVAKAASALKGHPERDAVRAWLLAEVAQRLLHKMAFHGELRGVGMAALREMDEILASPDGKKELDALVKTLKDTYRERFPAGTPGELFMSIQIMNAYRASLGVNVVAGKSPKLLSPEEEWKYARRFALEHWKVCCDGFFDYSRCPSKDESVKAAEEDLAMAQKGPPFPAARMSLRGNQGRDVEIGRFRFRLARCLRDAGRSDDAIAQFETLLKSFPDGQLSAPKITGDEKYDIRLELATLLQKTGKTDQAIGMLLAARKARPADLGVLKTLAKIYESAGRKTDAVKSYKEMRELTAKPAEKEYATLRIDIIEGRIVEGPKTDLDNSNTKKLYDELSQTVTTLQQERKFEEALTVVRDQALKAFPNDAPFMRKEIDLLEKLAGHEEEHKAKLDDYARIHPEDAIWAKNELAAAQTRTKLAPLSRIDEFKDPEGALQAIREQSQKYPNDLSLQQRELDLLIRLDRLDEADQLLKKYMAAASPQKADSYRKMQERIAQAAVMNPIRKLSREGKFEEALDKIQTHLKTKPKDLGLKQEEIKALINLNRFDDARKRLADYRRDYEERRAQPMRKDDIAARVKAMGGNGERDWIDWAQNYLKSKEEMAKRGGDNTGKAKPGPGPTPLPPPPPPPPTDQDVF